MNTAASNSYLTRLRPLRPPRVCVAVTASDPASLIEQAEVLAKDNFFLELRLDYLPRPALAISRIRQFSEDRPHVMVIATCRRVANGGKFRGSVASQLDILMKAALAGCKFVDVELQSAARCKPEQIQKLRSQAALVLSFHDFHATKNLDQTLEKMVAISADYYKVVSTATSLYDNVVMMKFLEKNSDKHSLIGLCMGEQGIISRVLGVRAGSVFTFAAVSEDKKTAPGQITAPELRNTYRIEQVDTATRVYGVAGDPVAHSLSPVIMNAALRRETVNGVYVALHAKTLKDLLACIRDIPIHGISVTMPYKGPIVEHLDNSDTDTSKIGACNTIVRAQDGKLYGFNTDATGVVRPLQQRLTLDQAKVLVLGAGGAARAAVFGLKERGSEVYILARTPAQGQKLARQAKARSIKRPDLAKLTFDVIINATPVGMGNSKESPLKENEIKAKYVFDMVYDPPETKFLKMAKAAGAEIISGVEMFVHQAARQFEIWTGKPAPWDEMLWVIGKAIAGRAAAGANPDGKRPHTVATNPRRR